MQGSVFMGKKGQKFDVTNTLICLFQIILEGIRGSDPRSDIAIDDVVIRYGGCEGTCRSKSMNSFTQNTSSCYNHFYPLADTSTEDFDMTTLAPSLTSSDSVIPHPGKIWKCIHWK